MTPKKRFMIFERDKYKCQYCGRGAPDVMLEIDHVIPRASGGTDDLHNLKTACWECNRGKGGLEQSDIVQRIVKMKMKETDVKLKKYFYDSWNEKNLGTIENDTNILLMVWLSVCLEESRYQGSLNPNDWMNEYALYQQGGAFVDEVLHRMLAEEKVYTVDDMLEDVMTDPYGDISDGKTYEDRLHRWLIIRLSNDPDNKQIMRSKFVRYKHLLCG